MKHGNCEFCIKTATTNTLKQATTLVYICRECHKQIFSILQSYDPLPRTPQKNPRTTQTSTTGQRTTKTTETLSQRQSMETEERK